MMKNFLIIVFLLSLFTLFSCEIPHSQSEYMPLVIELHKIECDEVSKAGILFTVNDTNIYTFREIAFDRIMTKNPNAFLIAHFEEIYQRLAVFEFNMDDNEKLKYRENVKNEYLKPCK